MLNRGPGGFNQSTRAGELVQKDLSIASTNLQLLVPRTPPKAELRRDCPEPCRSRQVH